MDTDRKSNRFIPLRKADIIEACIRDARWTAETAAAFREFCRILDAVFHYQFHQRLETLKDCYAPFNPDADTLTTAIPSAEEKDRLQKKLVQELVAVLDAANFERITARDLQDALGEESLFKIRLEVEFDDFEEVIFYRRGESVKRETLIRLFGLVKKPIVFTHYDRVLVFIKFKDADYFAARKQKDLFFAPGATLIKLFQNVPKADLEMLFPNSRIRMKTIDKIIIGVPAAVSGIIVVATKLGASLVLVAAVVAFWLGLRKDAVLINQQHLIALGIGLTTLAGFLFRQYNKFKNRKIRFMKTLADNLYFKNLDNNAGVFYHLINEAEEEEFKEALLAYYALISEKGSLDKRQLDARVERKLREGFQVRFNFEVDDAVAKLERLQLIRRRGEVLIGEPLPVAKQRLDQIWDSYFQFNREASGGPSPMSPSPGG
jgi:hypothetical protein